VNDLIICYVLLAVIVTAITIYINDLEKAYGGEKESENGVMIKSVTIPTLWFIILVVLALMGVVAIFLNLGVV
jgi:hypothetical protein